MYKMNLSLSLGNKKMSVRLEIILLVIIVFGIIWLFTLGSTCKIGYQEGMTMLDSLNQYVSKNLKEGFAGNNIASTAQWGNAYAKPVDTKKWNIGNLVYTPGQKPDKAIQKIWNRPKQTLPLPKDELFFFYNTQFKPECCDSYMSTGSGCACLTVEQYNYLRNRGGNNVPYSEY